MSGAGGRAPLILAVGALRTARVLQEGVPMTHTATKFPESGISTRATEVAVQGMRKQWAFPARPTTSTQTREMCATEAAGSEVFATLDSTGGRTWTHSRSPSRSTTGRVETLMATVEVNQRFRCRRRRFRRRRRRRRFRRRRCLPQRRSHRRATSGSRGTTRPRTRAARGPTSRR